MPVPVSRCPPATRDAMPVLLLTLPPCTGQAAFKLLAALVAKLGSSVIEPLLGFVVDPLYRIAAGKEKGYEAEQLADLVTEVIQVVEQTVGTERFYKEYNSKREVAEANRKKRRADLAAEAIANPEKHAQRKIGKADRRKRKADEAKAAAREAGGSANAKKKKKTAKKGE